MTDSPQERREAARVRRRLVTLGELLAIAAVVISALTFWNSWRERTDVAAEHAAESAKARRAAATLVLRATPEDDGRRLALAPRGDGQAIQSQTIVFPAALALAPVETTGDARIEREWFDDALIAARKRAGFRDAAGDARLPVEIVTRFLADGTDATDRALFEIGYESGHAFLSGTTIRLKGLSRVSSVPDDAAGRRALEALAKGRLSLR